MKSKNFILLCLFIFVLSIAAVSASEDANQTSSMLDMESPDADIASAGEDIDQTLNLQDMKSNDADIASDDVSSNDNQNLGQSENDGILTDGARTWYVNSSQSGGDGLSPESAFKTVNDTLDKINDGDTIMIASGLYAGSGNVDLTINKNVTLKKYGDGDAIFDGNNTSRFIYVYSKSTLCINIYGLTFKNGNSALGGAIYFKSAISDSNVNATFINNHASVGGAIYFEFKVTNSIISGTYINNTADSDGGAVDFVEKIEGSTIGGTYINNTGNAGGANYFQGEVKNSKLTGTYINNKAQRWGGANYFNKYYSSDSSFKYSFVNSILNATFINNRAGVKGGANYFYGPNGVNTIGTKDSIITGTYINNSALDNAGSYYSRGGANCFDQGIQNTTVSGTYINNRAEFYGGANYFFECDTWRWGISTNSTIGGTYINNTSPIDGSAVFVDCAVDLYISARFINNTGHTILCFYPYYKGYDSKILVENSIFLNNKGDYEIYSMYDGVGHDLLIAKNNWFGNNVTNYPVKAKVHDVDMNTWLFLNGTMTEDNVKFFLMSYNDTSKTTSLFDNTLVGTVNLTVNAYYSTTDKSHAVLNEVVNYVTLNKTDRPAGIVGKIENARMVLGNKMGEFDYLQEYINNHSSDAIVYIDRNYTYNELDSITQGVVINSNMIIDGQGFTIDAKGNSRIFNINANVVKITNMTLQNGYADNGGAICFANGILRGYIDANFINNTATESGGAINFLYGAIDSTIAGTYSGNKARRGGANYFDGEVSNSTVTGTYTQNTATYGGANHFAHNIQKSTLSGTYIQNTAAYDGGANSFNQFVLYSTITGTYTANRAQRGAANYFNNKVYNSCINGTYTQNTAILAGANDFNQAVSDSIISGTYTGNTAAQDGGANYFYQELSASSITGTYENNVAAGNGGANCFMDYLMHQTITGVYINNKAANGGANYFDSYLAYMTITGEYINNTAVNGGANYFTAVSGSNVSGTYAGNKATQNGGANHFNDRVDDVAIVGAYTGNEAANGGVNYFVNEVEKLNMDGTYENNTAQSGGVNYFDKKVSNSKINGTYTGNNASSGVAGVNRFAYGASGLTMDGTYTRNNAKTMGGVNYILRSFTGSSISGTYTDNTAQGGGANYMASVSNSNITGTYTENSAGSGGANYLGSTTSSNVAGTYTRNNATATRGGAIYFSGMITGSSISGTYTDNTAKQDGGAIYFNNKVSDSDISGTYSENKATEQSGGAIYFYRSVENSRIGGTFTENKAKNDGGANHFMEDFTSSNITATFTNNTADNGGANYFNQAVENSCINGTYAGNKAAQKGGANFLAAVSNSKIAGTFSNNTAVHGGANYFGEVQNAIITGTYAGNEVSGSGKGGALYFLGSITGSIISGTYMRNVAESDSTIHIDHKQTDVIITNAVFLNNRYNGENGEIYYTQKTGVTANNNWFGNTADNYTDVVPCKFTEVWLFMNATAIPLGDACEVVFKLYAYNSTSGEISDFDNTLLEPVNLTITTNGVVDKDIANLGETITFTPTGAGLGTVTASVENVAYTIQMDIKANPKLSVGNQEVYYSNSTTIVLNYNSYATGTVNITLKGKKHNYAFYDKQLNATISLGNISADEYNVTVEYSGNDLFNGATANGTLKVNKANSTLTVGDVKLDYGQTTSITATAEGATSITAKINDENATVVDGYTIVIPLLAAGNYTLTVTTVPDDNHVAVTKTANITISKINSTLDISGMKIIEGKSANITAQTNGTTGIIAKIDGENATVVDGYTILIPALNEGTHYLTVTTMPDANHTEVNMTVTITSVGKTTMEALQMLIDSASPGSTLILENDYKAKGYNYKNGIIVSKSLTIDGQGHTIDGDLYMRLFRVTNNSNVVFKNLNLIRGWTATGGYGGAIWENNAEVTAINCTFKNNQASYGGAVSGVKAINCTFYSNRARAYGCAIYIGGSETIDRCIFVGNTGDKVGAIYWTNIQNSIISNCIFLNDTRPIFTEDYSNNLIIDNCWFGNTAANYRNSPTNIVKIDSWLFLNATADPNPVGLFNKSDIVFELYLYNSTSGEISRYDSSLLMPVDLTISATEGSTDKVTVQLEDSIKYTAESGTAGSVTAKFENVQYSIRINHIQFDSNLSVESQEVTYGGNVVISLNYNSTATGTVNITLNGKKHNYVFQDRQLNATISLGNLNADEYDVVVEYSGSPLFSNATATATLKVNRANSTVSFDAPVWDYGTSVNVTVTTTGATGITAKIGNRSLEVDGFVIIMPDDLDAGQYNMTVTTMTDENHNQANRTSEISVRKVNSTIEVADVNIECDIAFSVNVTFTGATGIEAEIEGWDVRVEGFTILVPALNVGKYTLTVKTLTDENHNPTVKNATVNVRKTDSTLTVTNITFDYGASGSATVTFTGATGVIAEVVNQSGAIVNVGKNNITVSNLDAGTYILMVTTMPDDDHSPVTKTANITVNSLATAISASNKAYVINYGGEYSVTLVDSNGKAVGGKEVTFTLNGKDIGSATTNANGVATITLTANVLKNARAGSKNLLIKFAGDTNYNAASKTVKITISKEKTKIAAKKKTFKKSKKTKKYKITLKNSKGKAIKKVKITLKVKGKTYTAKTNSKGKATFKIKKLKRKGTFKATIKFKGDNCYKASSKKVKIKIR